MTKKEYLSHEYSLFMEGYVGHTVEFYTNPSIAMMDPFKIADNLYYVGDKKVCIHLVDTGDGLILIDSGYFGAAHLLVDNIWRAGFDPRDIKLIIHTHGHTDHYGASDEFRRMYGCKLAISRVDEEVLRPLREEGRAMHGFFPLSKVPEFDMLIEDGDVIEMGNTKIRCVLTPGHTPGVITLFFDTTYEGKTYPVGLYGGAGINALTLKYIYSDKNYTSYIGCDRDMLKSIEKIWDEPVVIHLGNHPGNNKTLEKREKMIKEGGNPFVDPESWHNFLGGLRDKTKWIIEENDKLESKLDDICDK